MTDLERTTDHVLPVPEHDASPANEVQTTPSNTAGKAVFGVSRTATRTQGAGPLDPEIASDIDAARHGGQTLDAPVRTEMESHLGYDLSGVRVHTGATADHLARSVQADAFTTGSDIFFKGDNYAPSSTDGKRMLAHELTHVVQQSTGAVGNESRVSDPADSHEVEAAAVGDAVAAAGPAATTTPSPTTVSREESDDASGEAGGVFRADEELPEEEEMEEPSA